MIEILDMFKTITAGGIGIWLGVGMFGVYMYREFRETRKLSAEDRLARRDGYSKQVENLQRENRELRNDVTTMERKHTEYRQWCEEQHDKDRAMIRALQDELTGVKRMIAAGQVAMMDVLPPNIVPTVIKDAADRTAAILKDKS